MAIPDPKSKPKDDVGSDTDQITAAAAAAVHSPPVPNAQNDKGVVSPMSPSTSGIRAIHSPFHKPPIQNSESGSTSASTSSTPLNLSITEALDLFVSNNEAKHQLLALERDRAINAWLNANKTKILELQSSKEVTTVFDKQCPICTRYFKSCMFPKQNFQDITDGKPSICRWCSTSSAASTFPISLSPTIFTLHHHVFCYHSHLSLCGITASLIDGITPLEALLPRVGEMSLPISQRLSLLGQTVHWNSRTAYASINAATTKRVHQFSSLGKMQGQPSQETRLGNSILVRPESSSSMSSINPEAQPFVMKEKHSPQNAPFSDINPQAKEFIPAKTPAPSDAPAQAENYAVSLKEGKGLS